MDVFELLPQEDAFDSQCFFTNLSPNEAIGICESSIIGNTDIILKIENLVCTVKDQILNNNGEDITICFNKRGSDVNTMLDEQLGIFVQYDGIETTKLSLVKSPKRFAVFMTVLAILHNSLKRDEVLSKRSIFYQNVSLFQTQETVDDALEDIACCLEVPRTSLGVIACPRGEVAGPLQWVNEQNIVVDCSLKIESVPSNVDLIRAQKTSAVAILVVEKDTVFMRLVQSPLVNDLILITGRGFPDYSTRLFVKLLEDTFSIPILGLFDLDPFGISIMKTYRFGSRSSAYDNINMASTRMKWLGLHPSDFSIIPKSNIIELNENERKMLLKYLNEDNLPNEIKNEIEIMLRNNQKAEIESIGFDELVNFYIPQKISMKDWL